MPSPGIFLSKPVECDLSPPPGFTRHRRRRRRPGLRWAGGRAQFERARSARSTFHPLRCSSWIVRSLAAENALLLAFLVTALAPLGLLAQEPKNQLSIAAAADLVYCLEELNRDFAKANPGVKVKVSTGSSGNFFAQIKNGAPFDLFMSADMNFPRQLAREGLADESSLTSYGIGRIVLWTVKDGIAVSRGLAVVTDPAIHKLALANPDHAPYGRAAKAALEHQKLWEGIREKIVLGENVAQTAQFVQTGHADAGIVALSLVLSPVLAKVGRYAEIPPDFHPALEQGAVITSHGANNPLAKRYMDFLRSAKARGILDRYGFR